MALAEALAEALSSPLSDSAELSEAVESEESEPPVL